MAAAAQGAEPATRANLSLTVTRGVTAGWIAGIPQVLAAQEGFARVMDTCLSTLLHYVPPLLRCLPTHPYVAVSHAQRAALPDLHVAPRSCTMASTRRSSVWLRIVSRPRAWPTATWRSTGLFSTRRCHAAAV